MSTIKEDCKEFKMNRNGKASRKKRHLAAFFFVPFAFGDKFPAAEF
jgi:hypothetical protein